MNKKLMFCAAIGAVVGAALGAIHGSGDKTASDNARTAIGAVPRLIGWWNS